MAVVSVAPESMLPFVPQECVVPELFCVLSTGVRPAPGEADAVTVEELGAGELILNPDGKFHWARDKPQRPAPAGGALLTVRLAEADFPVSNASTKR